LSRGMACGIFPARCMQRFGPFRYLSAVTSYQHYT
jgi:hypothetical protein